MDNNEEVIKYYQGKDAGNDYDEVRYGGAAGAYRQALIRQNMTSALSIFKPDSQKRILELAPGSGVLTTILLDQFKDTPLVAIDSSQRMISILGQKFTNQIESGILTIIHGDAQRLPFAESQFDLVCSLRLLIHYKDPTVFLGEIARVLKPGGIALVDAHNFFRLDFPNVMFRRFINPKGIGSVPSFYLTPWELKRVYRSPNLKIISLIGHKLLPPNRLILRLLSDSHLLNFERIISKRIFKYMCADLYILLKKDVA